MSWNTTSANSSCLEARWRWEFWTDECSCSARLLGRTAVTKLFSNNVSCCLFSFWLLFRWEHVLEEERGGWGSGRGRVGGSRAMMVEVLGRGGWGGGGVRLIDETICCPQLAVATPMGLEILTHFDNVSVELYPWLCAVRVCEGVTVLLCVCVCVSLCLCVCVCMCVDVRYAVVFSHSSSLATLSSYSHLVLLVRCAKFPGLQLQLHTHTCDTMLLP